VAIRSGEDAARRLRYEERVTRIAVLADRALPFWFAAWSLILVVRLVTDGRIVSFDVVGFDFQLYRHAAADALAGGDPWAASETLRGSEFHFAALPTAVLLFLPFALVPPAAGFVIYTVVSVGVLAIGLRRIRAPLWWLLFAPTVMTILVGNPSTAVLAFLLVGGPAGRAIAAALKIYAVVPMVARREGRALAAVVVVVGASILVAPELWSSYVTQAGTISDRLLREAQGGLSASGLLGPELRPAYLSVEAFARISGLVIAVTSVALILVVAVRDVAAAGWLTVPLLWPASEVHYATFAIPIARRLSTWILAIPLPLTYLLGLVILAYEIASARPELVPQPPAVGLAQWTSDIASGLRRTRQAPG
jgi:uncharacterized protein YjeT (DUF2065 family)